MMEIVVLEEGKRIDNYLIDKLNISRSKIQKLIKEGYILVNKNKCKNSYILHINDVINIIEKEEEEYKLKGEDIPLDIIYEDNDILVINKPSGMVVHPGNGNYNGTLANALINYSNSLSNINGEFRPGIVHRIDADTSGLLVVAKNDKAHISLQDELKNNKTNRKYLALVSGVIKEDTATIDAPIGRDTKDRKKMTVTSLNSKKAITHIKVLERYKKSTLIECSLETGRTHQIRVHLKYINHPIINDRVYNPKEVISKEFGQMLHAYTLGFTHPTKNTYMEFKVNPPIEFNNILNLYKNND